MQMQSEITPIISVGVVGDSRLNDGRLIPFIIAECSHNPDLEQLIEIHDSTPPGDVACAWGWKRFNKSKVFLTLVFSRPMKVVTHFAFSVEAQGYIVDWIINARGLYLQSSRYGNRVSQGLGSPSILVEVPISATFPIWADLYERSLVRIFKKKGYSKRQAKEAAQEYKARQRELWFRRKAAPNVAGE